MGGGWSDDVLINFDFRIVGRPDEDDGLTREKPGADARIEFLREYNITPPQKLPKRREVQPYIWCALCQEPTHWKGWEAKVTENGETRRVLIGCNCAQQKGGQMVRLAARDFTARVQRRDLLRARLAVANVLPTVMGALQKWRDDPAVVAISSWREQLSGLSHALARALQSAAEIAPPALLLETRVRDFAAEALRDKRSGDRGDAYPIYKAHWEAQGVLHCRAVYFGATLQARIVGGLAELTRCSGTLRRSTTGMTTRELANVLKEIRDILVRLKAIERDFSKVEVAFEPAELDLIVKWYNALPKDGIYEGERLSRTSTFLVLKPRYGKQKSSNIPVSGPVVCPAELELLESALLGHEMVVDAAA